jgi:transposase
VPDATTCERRELLHAYNKAVADHTAAINSLKGYLNQFTIRAGSRAFGTEKTEAWILAQRAWTPLQSELLADYFQNLRAQTERRKAMLRLIGRQICAEPLMLRCMKLLGIGQINAFALLAVIGDVRRFERPEKLVAYIGLNPGQRESGRGKNIKLGVGKRGRGDMRHLLVQGAHAVLRMGKNTPLGQWGWKLFARKGQRNIAVTAVARKLLVQVWHLLSGNPPMALETDKSHALKLKKLAVMLGTDLRAQLALPSKVQACVAHLQNLIIGPQAAT